MMMVDLLIAGGLTLLACGVACFVWCCIFGGADDWCDDYYDCVSCGNRCLHLPEDEKVLLNPYDR